MKIKMEMIILFFYKIKIIQVGPIFLYIESNFILLFFDKICFKFHLIFFYQELVLVKKNILLISYSVFFKIKYIFLQIFQPLIYWLQPRGILSNEVNRFTLNNNWLLNIFNYSTNLNNILLKKNSLLVSDRRQFHNKKLAFILPNFDGVKRIGPHNWDILSILVGSLLGGCEAKREKSGGVRFIFKQCVAEMDYIFWLQDFLKKIGYCNNNLPVLSKEIDKFNGKYYYFFTYRYTSLLYLYKLFYNNKKQKKIPKNIADLLTPLSLAIWISDSGVYIKSGIRFIINSYKFEYVYILSLALKNKFNINSIIYKNNGIYYLIIKFESIALLKKLLKPYNIPNLSYKLGL